MSRNSASFVLGYHGCSKEVGLKALTEGASLMPSNEDFDWLGPGIYFWEADPKRAFEWAEGKVDRGSYEDPFVIGAIIDLGHCLDLMQRENIELLTSSHDALARLCEAAKTELPKNKDPKKLGDGDRLLRFLDCAVIRHLHSAIDAENKRSGGTSPFKPFDTVRGLFVEGKAAYKGGSFFTKTHTQIAVINSECIKGVFRPAGF